MLASPTSAQRRGAARWRRRNIALLLLLVRMRAHVVIVFGCWDDWGVWEDSSSIYLYSLSVHHARIVELREGANS